MIDYKSIKIDNISKGFEGKIILDQINCECTHKFLPSFFVMYRAIYASFLLFRSGCVMMLNLCVCGFSRFCLPHDQESRMYDK